MHKNGHLGVGTAFLALELREVLPTTSLAARGWGKVPAREPWGGPMDGILGHV